MKNPAIKVFLSGALVLLLMLIATGVLTYIIPNGIFDFKTMQYSPIETRGVPPITILLSPLLVLFSDSGLMLIVIILFLLIIGGALNLLKETGIISYAITKITSKFKNNESLLIASMTLFFMSLGAFIGVFEEAVPLLPIILVLGLKLHWDAFTSLGVSILATGLGFSAAVSNPFTLGVAQTLADVPIFSGAGLRFLVFLSVYLILTVFLIKRTSKNRLISENTEMEDAKSPDVPKASVVFFAMTLLALFIIIVISPFVEFLRTASMPLIALLLLVGAIGAGALSKQGTKTIFKHLSKGFIDMSPAIILILLASAIKHVMEQGHILDTVLYYVSIHVRNFSPFFAVLGSYLLVFVLNFFIGSGSAKAFILMPVLMPLMDIIGVSRQLGILAFQFGDGFSNVLFPTNAVLLISLSLAKVSYWKWLKFILPLQIVLALLSCLWLYIGLIFGY